MEPEKQKEKYILMSYRQKIVKCLQTTYYNSDSGWGCMLRVGQMLIANYFLIKEKGQFNNIVPLFYDNIAMPYSIQRFTEIANQIYPNKKQYQWFNPCQCGFIIKSLIERYDEYCRVSICNDNTLFLSDLQTDRKKIIVLIMCRIGLQEPEEPYLQCIVKLTKMKHFFAIMGGTPKRAHLFLKHQNKKFGFLDPHKTLKTNQNLDELIKHIDQYHGKLQWINEDQIDCSMAICFCFDTQEVHKFWAQMEEMKKELGDRFFIYMEKTKPELNQHDIIQVFDDI